MLSKRVIQKGGVCWLAVYVGVLSSMMQVLKREERCEEGRDGGGVRG